jgi:hypothetical protein
MGTSLMLSSRFWAVTMSSWTVLVVACASRARSVALGVGEVSRHPVQHGGAEGAVERPEQELDVDVGAERAGVGHVLHQAQPEGGALGVEDLRAEVVGGIEQGGPDGAVEGRVGHVHLDADVDGGEQALQRLGGALLGEAVEELADVVQHREQDGALGAEEVVGRGQADAGARRQCAHGEAGVAGLADQVVGGADDAAAPLGLAGLAPADVGVFRLGPRLSGHASLQAAPFRPLIASPGAAGA